MPRINVQLELPVLLEMCRRPAHPLEGWLLSREALIGEAPFRIVTAEILGFDQNYGPLIITVESGVTRPWKLGEPIPLLKPEFTNVGVAIPP